MMYTMSNNWNNDLWKVFCVYCLLARVMAQDAFPVALTASAHKDVPVSTKVNLTCAFKVQKENFLRVRLLENDKLVFDYPGSPSDKWPRIVKNGTSISEDPETDASIWVTIMARLCDNPSGRQIYKCLPFNRRYEYGTGTTHVTYAEPSRNLYINGTEVLPNKTYKLESDAAESQHTLTFVTSDERSPVIGLSLTIGDKTITTFTNNSKADVCSYGAQLEHIHQFSADKEHVVRYTVRTQNDDVHGDFKIAVEGYDKSAGSSKSPLLLAVAAVICIGLLILK